MLIVGISIQISYSSKRKIIYNTKNITNIIQPVKNKKRPGSPGLLLNLRYPGPGRCQSLRARV